MKRNESDQKREIASKNNQIEELKTDIKMKNTAHLSDLTQINAEKHSLEQEITTLRWSNRLGQRGSRRLIGLSLQNAIGALRPPRKGGNITAQCREQLAETATGPGRR